MSLPGKLSVSGLVAAVTALVCCCSAMATAGSTIGSAPSVVYGQQQFGNDMDGTQTISGYISYWLLGVTTGDRVTVDWQATGESDEYASVYPVGTNDFNLSQAHPDAFGNGTTSGFSQVVFNAPASGTMPMSFVFDDSYGGTGAAGPYNFTASVEHSTVLGVPPGPIRRRGKLKVGVHTPDGAPVQSSTLQVVFQIKAHGGWITVGRAHVVNGTASLRITIQRKYQGKRINTRARDFGAGYISETSRSRAVRVR